ncbi:hypothetical protein TNCV_1876661 [Trichonephila clavipes]|nr:hypothetical protein TNCV_1876661 [Trichonephila clavipes]
MCLVVLLMNLGSINLRFCVQKTCSRPNELQHLQRPFSIFRHEGEEPLLAAALQTTFKHQEEESPLIRCEIVNWSVKKTSCHLFSTDDSEGTAFAGQENMFLGRSNNGLLCCSQTSPDLQWNSGGLLIWRE